MNTLVTLLVAVGLLAMFRDEITWLLRVGAVLILVGLVSKASPDATAALAGPLLMLVLMAVAVSFLFGRPGRGRGGS